MVVYCQADRRDCPARLGLDMYAMPAPLEQAPAQDPEDPRYVADLATAHALAGRISEAQDTAAPLPPAPRPGPLRIARNDGRAS